jgi:hypothetical protein
MSRFRLGKRSPQLQAHHNDQGQGQGQDVMELRQWTDYCAENTLEIKNGSLRSLPVLSNNGSHSLYWSKKIVSSDGEMVNTDESLLQHSLQKLNNSTR